MELTRIQGDTAKGHPVESRRPIVSNPLDQLHAQESSFADRLSKLLMEKNITQEELADRIGCTQSAISKMLTRNARPRRTTIFKLSTGRRILDEELLKLVDSKLAENRSRRSPWLQGGESPFDSCLLALCCWCIRRTTVSRDAGPGTVVPHCDGTGRGNQVDSK